MKIESAIFEKSSSSLSEITNKKLPEYCFIGRSNVGKSSLINFLTNKKNLAKTSSKPGKTQLINHFLINNNWYLVDLPGYGWAQASKSSVEHWENMIYNYLLNSSFISCVFLLIDSRHSIQKNDLNFMLWLGKNQIPFVLIFTKIDKLPKTKVDKQIKQYIKQLNEYWDENPTYFITSSELKTGADEILKFINDVNNSIR